jgi:hypothetical protein
MVQVFYATSMFLKILQGRIEGKFKKRRGKYINVVLSRKSCIS